MKIRLFLLSLAVLAASCGDKTNQADAYGNFEATEVIVSAETSGRILKFDISEGMDTDSGAVIAVVDTMMFHLQKAEIDAGMKSIKARVNSFNAQNEILNQQISNLNVNIERIGNMLKDNAATQKQFDDLTGQAAVIRKQIDANNAQKASVASELTVFESKKATLNEQIERCSVKSPLNGTIIEKYAEAGEMAATGKPLLKIADLSLIKLKVYVSGAQLGRIKIGNKCTVRIDDGKNGYQTFPGVISYISGKAEFTPKIIQTKEERVTLVYAVTIDVSNDGTMKSGMPGEAIF